MQIYPWVTTVWHAYKRGVYLPAKEAIGDPFFRRHVRVGTYGDPAAVPLSVWAAMLRSTRGFTMYTHLWRTCDQGLAEFAMASVDSPEEQQEAQERGWRTFRTRFGHEALMPNEMVCPASEEALKRQKCCDCLLCDGFKGEILDKRKNIAIIAHGSGGGWYTAARSSMNARSQRLLPIVP